MVDSEAAVQHRCRRCGKEFKSDIWLNKHEARCNEPIYLPEEEGKKWVACKICGHKGVRIGKHLKSAHGLTTKEYTAQFPDALTSALDEIQKMSEACNWIDRAKENGDDLSEYRQRMGAAVSQSIMSNPEERARRSVQMAVNNQTPEAREKSRVTAKKTSQRQDILDQRTHNLANWREKHPDDFAKCTNAMLQTSVSSPELELFYIIDVLSSMKVICCDVKRQQRIQDVSFTASKTHMFCVDITCIFQNVCVHIEIDGIHHFQQIASFDLNKRQRRDQEFENWINARNDVMLVRLSYDTWETRRWQENKEKMSRTFFSQPALEALFSLLKNPKPGVHCIGQAYGERNLLCGSQ